MKSNKFKKNAIKILVSTLNTRTLSSDAHLIQLEEALMKINYDIIGLSEVKRIGEEIVQREDFIFFYHGISRRRGSIGFIIHKRWKNNIKVLKSFSDRGAILILQIGSETFGCLQAYAPTSSAPKQEMDEFYNDVLEALSETSICTWSCVLGDFNAKIGLPEECDVDIMGKFGYGQRNDRGERLISFVRSQQLFIANTMFFKKATRKYTWLNSVRNEIDFVMIPKSQKHCVINVDVLSRFEYETDHKMVRMELCLHIKTQQKFFKPNTKFVIVNDSEKIEAFNEAMIKTFQTKVYSTSLQENYDDLCKVFKNSAEPFKAQKLKQAVITRLTKQRIAEREDLRSKRHQSHEIELSFRQVRNECNKLISRDVRTFEIQQMENAIVSGRSWKNAKNGVNNSKNWVQKLKDENGVLQFERDAILEISAKFYEKLYSSRMSEDVLKQLEPDLSGGDELESFSIDEIKQALFNMKNGRATGSDNLPSDLLKICDDVGLEMICKLFNDVLETEVIPQQWKKSTIIILHKKGIKRTLRTTVQSLWFHIFTNFSSKLFPTV